MHASPASVALQDAEVATSARRALARLPLPALIPIISAAAVVRGAMGREPVARAVDPATVSHRGLPPADGLERLFLSHASCPGSAVVQSIATASSTLPG